MFTLALPNVYTGTPSYMVTSVIKVSVLPAVIAVGKDSLNSDMRKSIAM